MTTLAIIGAAGAMGTRITNTLKDDPDFTLLYVETPEGEAKLRARGQSPTSKEGAAQQADAFVFAVRDDLIQYAAAEIVPLVKPGTILIALDPAAPYAGHLPDRPDVTYFVTHPAHPPIFHDETDPKAINDHWGDGYAKQAIVNALMQGPEEHYAVGEGIARKMFGPILRSHRITLEQMAILEPALSETVGATCATIIREAMDEAIKMGVPHDAARDFIVGHLKVELAIVFEEIGWKFSMGAQKAIAEAKKDLFQPDWKAKVFDIENIKISVGKIVGDIPS
ncbi:MAG: semialdehyde dehydrogenase [Candidatus Poribacteria bacterium]|nr:semialdehyde dehydrogenase [Candidatus Poribacteria bacterium]